MAMAVGMLLGSLFLAALALFIIKAIIFVGERIKFATKRAFYRYRIHKHQDTKIEG